MTPYKKRLNPFIQRMVEDMQVRNFAPSTIDSYSYQVDKFCQYFGRPADQLGPEEIRQYQLYLVNEKKASWSSLPTVCGLRLLYEVTLGKPWTIKHIPFGKRPKKLPTVLSDQEACQLIQCVHHPKHQTVLLTCYAAGLRLKSGGKRIQPDHFDLAASSSSTAGRCISCPRAIPVVAGMAVTTVASGRRIWPNAARVWSCPSPRARTRRCPNH